LPAILGLPSVTRGKAQHSKASAAAADRTGDVRDDADGGSLFGLPEEERGGASSNASSVNRNVKETGFETNTFTGFRLDSSANRVLGRGEQNIG